MNVFNVIEYTCYNGQNGNFYVILYYNTYKSRYSKKNTYSPLRGKKKSFMDTNVLCETSPGIIFVPFIKVAILARRLQAFHFSTTLDVFSQSLNSPIRDQFQPLPLQFKVLLILMKKCS